MPTLTRPATFQTWATPVWPMEESSRHRLEPVRGGFAETAGRSVRMPAGLARIDNDPSPVERCCRSPRIRQRPLWDLIVAVQQSSGPFVVPCGSAVWLSHARRARKVLLQFLAVDGPPVPARNACCTRRCVVSSDILEVLHSSALVAHGGE